MLSRHLLPKKKDEPSQLNMKAAFEKNLATTTLYALWMLPSSADYTCFDESHDLAALLVCIACRQLLGCDHTILVVLLLQHERALAPHGQADHACSLVVGVLA